LLGVGALIGYGIYRVTSFALGLGIPLFAFPLDYALTTIFLVDPFIFSIFKHLVVAVSEEVLKVFSIFVFANWVYERFRWDEPACLSSGITLGSIPFILAHIPAWGMVPDIAPYLFGLAVSIAMSGLGWFFYEKKVWGPVWVFTEFSIWPAISSHLIYNLAIELHLRVYPGLLALILL